MSLYLALCCIGIGYAQEDNQSKALQSIVFSWNYAHTGPDQTLFQKIYGNSVWFYGQHLTREQCINNKVLLLKKSPDFSQTIKGSITSILLTPGIYKCSFDKSVFEKGKITVYPSYLVFQKHGGEWKIIGESDLITDKNLGVTFSIAQANEEISANENSEGSGFVLSIFELFILAGLVIFIGVTIYFLLIRRKNTDSTNDSSKKQRYGESKQVEQNEVFISADVSMMKRGYEFEKFIADRFNPTYFKLKHWSSDKSTGKVFAESNLNPDLGYIFMHKEYTYRFAVECKYRHKLGNGNIDIAKPEQLKRYKDYQEKNKIDVFIALGLGGKPNMPDELFFIPLKQINNCNLHYSDIAKYRQNIRQQFFYSPQQGAFTYSHSPVQHT